MLCLIGFLFALSVPAFLQQILGTGISDMPNQFSLEQPSSIYSILILLVFAIIWMGPSELAMGWIASLLLGGCVALKGALAFGILSRGNERVMLGALTAAALTLVMPLPNWWAPASIYLGQFAPTIWHNPTTIVALPLAMLLFLTCLRSLDAPTMRNTALASALCVLSAATKPAYLVVLLPVFLVWFGWKALARHAMPWHRLAVHIAILTVPVGLVLLIQSILVVTFRNSWITVAPFAVWSLYSPHPLASFLLSVAFPLAVAIVYRDAVRESAAAVLAWLTFLFAVAIFALLAETGPRFPNANFAWGASMAVFILFLASADVALRQPLTRRSLPVLAVFLMHLASGVYFYSRIVTGLGYR
jgi:hypothetical protein